MIYSPKCIDDTYGFDIIEGCLVPRKLGKFVMTIKECKEVMVKQNES